MPGHSHLRGRFGEKDCSSNHVPWNRQVQRVFPFRYNMVGGNSLLGPDIYQQGTLFAVKGRGRINARDWFFCNGDR